MDKQSGTWNRINNIVDIGFTAALFAELFVITQKAKYRTFCKRFINTYIELFWDSISNMFFTALDANDKHVGGYFARGQAWALEGLIPTYLTFHDEKVKFIIDKLVISLQQKQNGTGGWAYNFAHPLMGEDCKGVPIIAKNLKSWGKISGNISLDKTAEKAFSWCIKHTSMTGESAGGIFSYNVEGAVVHHLYTETAFVYSSAYALELSDMIGCEK